MRYFYHTKISIFFLVILFSQNSIAEKYTCEYKHTKRTIIFDRITHSHFKKCIDGNCDNKRYQVIYADQKRLIFGESILDDEKKFGGFHVFIVDKINNLFKESIISSPKSILENSSLNGQCLKNDS